MTAPGTERSQVPSPAGVPVLRLTRWVATRPNGGDRGVERFLDEEPAALSCCMGRQPRWKPLLRAPPPG